MTDAMAFAFVVVVAAFAVVYQAMRFWRKAFYDQKRHLAAVEASKDDALKAVDRAYKAIRLATRAVDNVGKTSGEEWPDVIEEQR